MYGERKIHVTYIHVPTIRTGGNPLMSIGLVRLPTYEGRISRLPANQSLAQDKGTSQCSIAQPFTQHMQFEARNFLAGASSSRRIAHVVVDDRCG